MAWFFNKKQNPEQCTLKARIVRQIAPMIDAYADWYAENGLALPPDFASDPGAWTENLRKMQRAFNMLNDELNGEGPLWEAKNKWKVVGEQDTEEIKRLEREIREGLTQFGLYILDLNDKEHA